MIHVPEHTGRITIIIVVCSIVNESYMNQHINDVNMYMGVIYVKIIFLSFINYNSKNVTTLKQRCSAMQQTLLLTLILLLLALRIYFCYD